MKPQKRRAQPKRITKPHSTTAAPANLNQAASQKRQELAKRRVQVAALYHARKTQEEIADALGVDQAQISRDLAALRETWKQQAVAVVAEVKADELAFYFDQRSSVIAQW